MPTQSGAVSRKREPNIPIFLSDRETMITNEELVDFAKSFEDQVLDIPPEEIHQTIRPINYGVLRVLDSPERLVRRPTREELHRSWKGTPGKASEKVDFVVPSRKNVRWEQSQAMQPNAKLVRQPANWLAFYIARAISGHDRAALVEAVKLGMELAAYTDDHKILAGCSAISRAMASFFFAAATLDVQFDVSMEMMRRLGLNTKYDKYVPYPLFRLCLARDHVRDIVERANGKLERLLRPKDPIWVKVIKLHMEAAAIEVLKENLRTKRLVREGRERKEYRASFPERLQQLERRAGIFGEGHANGFFLAAHGLIWQRLI